LIKEFKIKCLLLNQQQLFRKTKKIDGHISVDDFKSNVKSENESILALIERKSILKSKINEANQNTKVLIGEKTYTISEAINQKDIVEY
jgi:hypothetical protein